MKTNNDERLRSLQRAHRTHLQLGVLFLRVNEVQDDIERAGEDEG